MVRVNTLGATAIAAAITVGVASLEPAGTGAADLWSNRKAVSEEQLDTMRGGFEAPNGLQVSFGIERAVIVNGELVAATRVVVSNLPNLLNGGSATAQAIASTVVQNGPGNYVENQPAPVEAPTPSPLAAVSGTGAPAPNTTAAVSTAPVGAPTTSPGTGAAVPSTSVPVSATPVAAPRPSAAASAGASRAASTGLQPVQVNGQTLVIPTPTAIVMAVQNSLNNQVIQTRTSIDATMNSLSFLRAGAFSEAMRQQTLMSTRR